MTIRSLQVSKKTEDEVYELVESTVTFGDKGSNLCDYLYGVYEQAWVEGQDTTFLPIGRTGYGKSNLAALINIASQPIIREVTGLNRHLDFAKDVYWSGIDYVRGLQPIVLDVAATLVKRAESEIPDLVGKEALLTEALDMIEKEGVKVAYSRVQQLKKRYAFTSKWLDEPQDLNSADSMNTFNRELVKIKSGTRELGLLETICASNPWLIAPYVREEKTTAVFFVFPMRDKGQTSRAVRKLAIYDLKRYLYLMMADSRYVRRLMTSPLKLIKKFRPALLGSNVPLMPDCKEWKIYKVMKLLGTAKLPIQSIEKIEEKYGLRAHEEKVHEQFFVCPACGDGWWSKAMGKRVACKCGTQTERRILISLGNDRRLAEAE